MSNNEKGRKGEQLAENFLLDKGYSILERNWRYHRSEVDIICAYQEVLIVVEVKYRTSLSHGSPEAAINTAKQEMLLAAAESYWEYHEEYKSIRFDVISILDNRGNMEILHIEDAYF